MRSIVLATVFLIVLMLLCTVGVSAKKEKTKTFYTKYTEKKRKYCDFDGFEILPGSKWSTPDGCRKCTCTERFLKCNLITKKKRRQKNLGCF